MSKTAYEKIKLGHTTIEEVEARIAKQIANRPVYRKLPMHVLVEEYLAPNYLDVKDVVRIAKINPRRMQSLLVGEGKIDNLVAQKLGMMFRTGADYWLNLQAEYDAKGTLA